MGGGLVRGGRACAARLRTRRSRAVRPLTPPPPRGAAAQRTPGGKGDLTELSDSDLDVINMLAECLIVAKAAPQAHLPHPHPTAAPTRPRTPTGPPPCTRMPATGPPACSP